MKRGPAPNRGLRIAIPVALALGRVIFFMASPYYPGDFMIAGNGYLGIIRLRLSEKIRATLPEIQKDYSRSVVELASLPRGGPVCYELWLYSRYGRLRFFRITETGLEELDRSSIVFMGRKPEVTGREDAGAGGPRPSCPAGRVDSGTPVAAPAGAGNADPSGRIRRWLAKRNAAIRAGGGTNVLDPVILELLSGAGEPDAGTKRSSAGKKPAEWEAGATGPVAPGKNPDAPAPVSKAGRKPGKKPVRGGASGISPVDPEKFPDAGPVKDQANGINPANPEKLTDPNVLVATARQLSVTSQLSLSQEPSAALPGSPEISSPADEGTTSPTVNQEGT